MVCPDPTTVPPIIDAAKNALAFLGGVTIVGSGSFGIAHWIRRPRDELSAWMVRGSRWGFVVGLAVAVYMFIIYYP